MTNMLSCAVLLLVIGILLLLWWVHVWAVMRDITREDAERQADELFRDYIENCEYRVHIRMRITDEMGQKHA